MPSSATGVVKGMVRNERMRAVTASILNRGECADARVAGSPGLRHIGDHEVRYAGYRYSQTGSSLYTQV